MNAGDRSQDKSRRRQKRQRFFILTSVFGLLTSFEELKDGT